MNPYGRPCLPVADRRIIISATVKPAQRDFIKAYGGGSITRGIRAMIAVCSGLQAQAAQQRLTTEQSVAEKPQLGPEP